MVSKLAGRLTMRAVAASASAGPYEDALAAYDRNDLSTASRLYRVAAEQGHSQAQISLGLMYAFGRGVRRDPVEAVKWYRLAAAQGEFTHVYVARATQKPVEIPARTRVVLEGLR